MLIVDTAGKNADAMRSADGYKTQLTREGGLSSLAASIDSREPSPEQEAEILAVVDRERKAYAAERRH